MGYVAVKGGQDAILAAEELVEYYRVRGGSPPLQVEQIRDQQRLLVDRVMGEGALYSPSHAALALKQAEGDPLEAAFLLRAFRSTLPRTDESLPVESSRMEIIRRISAAFQDIPGGQFLGPTRDYAQRLLRFELREEDESHVRRFLDTYLDGIPMEPSEPPLQLPKLMDLLRREGLIHLPEERDEGPVDITREPLRFPAPRSARLQVLARGETGGMLALAYSSMRGYGDVHPTIGELRLGYLPLQIPHPETGEPIRIGRVLVTEAEVIARFGTGTDGMPQFTVGYGLCFGHNELKAISMAILDRAMNTRVARSPAEDEEFVLSHIDAVESAGFAAHYKLPHYVTFRSDLDRLHNARSHAASGKGENDADS